MWLSKSHDLSLVHSQLDIERYTTCRSTGIHSAHTALGVTNLPSEHARPRDIHHYVRGHWSIENRLHCNGHTNIAAGLRAMARNPTRPLTLFGIPA